MIPFPGESIGLAYAAAGTDDYLGGDIVYRGAEPNTSAVGYRTLADGDVWRVWVPPGAGTYLEEPDLDLDISWVLEVDSGTVTVTAAEDVDPDYGNLTATASNPLGSHSITGPGTLVIPSGFTTAQVWGDADGWLMLHLTATSGSAVVSQVKLRAWPTTGVVGGWSDVKPEWAGNWTAPSALSKDFDLVGEATTTSPETSWTFAWDGFADVDDVPEEGPHEFTTAAPNLYTYADQVRATLSDYYTGVSVKAALVVLIGVDWTQQFPIDQASLVEGVDWIRPPTEVNGDSAAVAQQVGAGGNEWRNANMVLTIAATDLPLGGIKLKSESYEVARTLVSPGVYSIDVGLKVGLPVASASPGESVTVTALNHDGRDIVAHITHDSMYEGGAVPGWPGTAPTLLAGFTYQCAATVQWGTLAGDPVQSRALMPPCRVWSLTPAVVTKLRQYHRDDGLGIAPRRAYGGASRNNTGRAYGYT